MTTTAVSALFQLIFVIFLCNLLLIKGNMFSWDTQFCCAGNISLRNSNISVRLSCCGNKTYNFDESICCQNSTLHSKKFGETTRCCGPKPYNHTKHVCCQREFLVRIPKDIKPEDVQCCDKSTPFNFRNQTCCGNKVFHKTSSHSKCCNITTNGTEEAVAIDPDKQLCCSSGPQPRANLSIACCGNSTYDKETEVCCGDDIRAASSPFMQCCGGEFPYSPDTSICCSGNVSHNHSLTCCGDKLVERATKCPYPMMDDGVALPVKCGDVEIDVGKQLCCIDRKGKKAIVKERKTPTTICCGTTLVDIKDNESKRCCNGKMVEMKEKEQCCKDNTEYKFLKVMYKGKDKKNFYNVYVSNHYF